MVTITIISVGAKPPPNLQHLIDDFLKRLPRSIHVVWSFPKHASGDARTSKQHESEKILRAIPDKGMVILLDEKGEQLSSPSIANRLFGASQDLVFVIGGAYGVSEKVHDRADLVWSLSKLVFPHQLVRLLLAEQLYRSYTISIGHPYHHD